MPYSAKVYRVMIASPSDVATEHELARKAVNEWNELHARTKQIVLELVEWKTHVAPQMGDHPQAIINKQLLEEADLLIGIFWTRIGTPTGQFISGTVEEIEKHISSGKPAMLYFSKQPVIPDSIDPEQYQQLKVFKNKCSKKGLLNEYESLAEFKENLYRHIVQIVNSNEYFLKSKKEDDSFSFEEALNTIEKREIRPKLTKEAEKLLIETAKDTYGRIVKIRTFEGLSIETNGINFVEKRNPRSEAIWEGALQELCDNRLIEDKGYKGEVFAITREGYELVDLLNVEGH
jgi:hypothetical protein